MSEFDPFEEERTRLTGPRFKEVKAGPRTTAVSILPADGWSAIISTAKSRLHPLACWTLIRFGDGENRVVGIVARGRMMVPAETVPNFQGYCPPGWTYDQWREQHESL